MMNGPTQLVNLESSNQELGIQLLKALSYKKAFEELEKEILFNASIGKAVAWNTMPEILNQIKKSNHINDETTRNI